jgi:hypothetical protein
LTVRLTVGQAQAGHKRAQMENGGFGDTVRHLDRGLTQNAERPLGINPADPVLLEQPSPSGRRREA